MESNGTRLVQARIPEELAAWFDENFGHGMKQTFISDCFHALRDTIQSGAPTRIYGRMAVARLTEE